MASNPFLAVDYKKRKDETGEREDPIVQVEIMCGSTPKVIEAYADTGCDTPLSITKEMADEMGLKRFSDETHEVLLADGSVVGAYLYEIQLRISGKPMTKMIGVIDPSIPKIDKPSSTIAEEPLLGRGIMDDYHVSFVGTSTPKRLVFH